MGGRRSSRSGSKRAKLAPKKAGSPCAPFLLDTNLLLEYHRTVTKRLTGFSVEESQAIACQIQFDS